MPQLPPAWPSTDLPAPKPQQIPCWLNPAGYQGPQLLLLLVAVLLLVLLVFCCWCQQQRQQWRLTAVVGSAVLLL
jgi:hypothetical protein